MPRGPTSTPDVARSEEICTIAEIRPPHCGMNLPSISGNPHACHKGDKRHGACSDPRRTGAPQVRPQRWSLNMIRSIAAALAAFALVSFAVRAEEAAKPAAEAPKAEAKEKKAEKKDTKKSEKAAEKTTEKAAEKPAEKK